MYYMLHVTDHPEAPILMPRAYRNTVSPLEPAWLALAFMVLRVIRGPACC